MAGSVFESKFRDQAFTEMDYMLRKYYDEHCARIVSSQVKAFSERQTVEYQKEYAQHLRTFGYNSGSSFVPKGDWVKRGAEDLMKDISSRFSGDKVLQDDLKSIADRWRQWAIARMGKEKYDQLSGCTKEKDLALVYVRNRFAQHVFDQVARSRMPKTSSEYIIQKMSSWSFVDWLRPGYLRDDKTEFDSKVSDRAEELYNPSFLEKSMGIGVGFALDNIALGPFFKASGMMFKAGKAFFTAAQAAEKGSAAGKAASAVVRASVGTGEKVAVSSVRKETLHLAEGNFVRFTGDGAKQSLLLPEKYAAEHAKDVDMAAKEMLQAASTDPSKVAGIARKFGLNAALVGICTVGSFMGCTPDDVDREISAAVAGDEKSFSNMRSDMMNVDSSKSRYLHSLNDILSNKVKLKDYRVSFSPHEQQRIRDGLFRFSGGDVSVNLENIRNCFADSGLSVKEGPVSQWMIDKGEKECLSMSQYYASVALEMKSCGASQVKVAGGKVVTLSEASQYAMDYARAGEELLRRRSQAEAEEQAQEEEVSQAAPSGGVSAEEERRDRRLEQMTEADGQWGGLMETLGLDGAGDMTHNLGYTLAMLPDMIFGMLTGKTKNLRIEDNIFPLMCIFGGMFVRNPLLRVLLIALGGMNLLNKGFKEVSGQEQQRVSRPGVYKRYGDEPVNPRVRDFHLVKGTDDASVVIDGQSYVCRLDSDSAAAYRQGVLSEGALCNALLREYDEQRRYASQAYARMDEERSQEAGVRMGV